MLTTLIGLPIEELDTPAVLIDLDALESNIQTMATDVKSRGAGWRPHVTVQNKVAPKAARELKAILERSFDTRPLAISGLGLHRYLGGPWDRLAIYPFRGR